MLLIFLIIINVTYLLYMFEIIKIHFKKCRYNLHQFLIYYVNVYNVYFLHLFLVIQCCSIYFLFLSNALVLEKKKTKCHEKKIFSK
jgi:hypothetical protein